MISEIITKQHERWLNLAGAGLALAKADALSEVLKQLVFI